MIQILQAFFYAHTNGVVHRDVKPSNILVTADDQIKVLDFGIAKLVGDSQHHLTKTGTQIGTVYYMSPEQVKGKELDHRSDIYSLGVTFYELLSGVCPYRGMTTEYEIYDSIVKEPLKSLVQTMGADYGDVWGVIANATQKDPLQRIKSCEEFIQCLVNESKHQYSEILDSSNINAKRGLPNKVVLLSILGSMCILLAIGLVFLIGGNVSSSGDQKELSNIQNDSESNISESYPIVKDKNELKNIHEPIPISQSNDVTTSIDKTSELKSEKVLEKKSLQAEVAVYEYVDNVPEFPGGSSALMSFIQKNVIYPQNAIEKNIQGRCYVKFIVKEDGSLSDITVERTILGCPECDKEAIRVVKMMPKWKPGMVKGKCVSSVMRLPFNFSLQ
jgi:TonB family protein